MNIVQMVPGDADDVLRIVKEWGLESWEPIKGDFGVVARDASGIAAFALVRELPFGFAVDEMWNAKTRRGRRGLAALVAWLEKKVLEVAQSRGCPITIGGIVRVDNTKHRRAMEGRMWDPTGLFYTKTVAP